MAAFVIFFNLKMSSWHKCACLQLRFWCDAISAFLSRPFSYFIETATTTTTAATTTKRRKSLQHAMQTRLKRKWVCL